MYGLQKLETFDALKHDTIEKMKAEYRKTGIGRANTPYGYIGKRA